MGMGFLLLWIGSSPHSLLSTAPGGIQQFQRCTSLKCIKLCINWYHIKLYFSLFLQPDVKSCRVFSQREENILNIIKYPMPLETDCLFFMEIFGPGKSLRKAAYCNTQHLSIDVILGTSQKGMGIASHGPYLDMVPEIIHGQSWKIWNYDLAHLNTPPPNWPWNIWLFKTGNTSPTQLDRICEFWAYLGSFIPLGLSLLKITVVNTSSTNFPGN